jgi:hypothetical protein
MAQGPRHLRDSFASTGVRFTEQTLSAAQKTQALTNIGALPAGEQTGLVLTTPVIDGVQYSALNDRQIVTVAFAVDGAALHAANLTALTFPAAAVILRVLLDVTTVSTGASTIDVGYTAVSATTSSDTLLDGVDGNAAIALFDSMDASLDLGANAHAQKAVSGKWITLDEASGDTTGLVATLYIQYILA